MKIEIELTEKELRDLIYIEFEKRLGELDLQPTDIKIEVKSTQNYKSEWENAAFRARVSKTTL